MLLKQTIFITGDYTINMGLETMLSTWDWRPCYQHGTGDHAINMGLETMLSIKLCHNNYRTKHTQIRH